jgi:hypothetical protein
MSAAQPPVRLAAENSTDIRQKRADCGMSEQSTGATAVVQVLAFLHLGVNAGAPVGIVIAEWDGVAPDGEQMLVEVGRISRVSGLPQRVADSRCDGFAAEGVAVCVPQNELTYWPRVDPVLDPPIGKKEELGTIGQRYLDCDHVLHDGSMACG